MKEVMLGMDEKDHKNMEILRDLDLTRRDCLRLLAIVHNLDLFIREAGDEDRSMFKTDLMKYERLYNHATDLYHRIERKLNDSMATK